MIVARPSFKFSPNVIQCKRARDDSFLNYLSIVTTPKKPRVSIKAGDILIIEPSFLTTPINDRYEDEMIWERAHQCLREIKQSLPLGRGSKNREIVFVAEIQGEEIIVISHFQNGKVWKLKSSDIVFDKYHVPEELGSYLTRILKPEINVIEGDSSKVIRDLTGRKKYDIAIFSPPYNHGTDRFYPGTYHDNMPQEEYETMLYNLFQVLVDIVVGPIIMNLNYFGTPKRRNEIVGNIAKKFNLEYVDLMWLKTVANPIQNSFKRIGENIYVFGKSTSQIDPLKGYEWWHKHDLKPITATVFEANNFTSEERKQQMTEHGYKNDATFSEQLVERLLATYAKPGYSVIDPFAGSGTTGYVCLKYGMDFTGIDIAPESCMFMRETLKSFQYEEQTLGMYATRLLDHLQDERVKKRRGL